MREIKEIIVHCSATPPDMPIGAKQIRQWHKEKGWSDIGYHFVIRRDGVVEDGRPVVKAGAHVAGRNKHSIGICLVGGVDKKNNPDANFTPEQYKALSTLLKILKAEYKHATIHGHNEFSSKACPSFNVQNWLKEQKI